MQTEVLSDEQYRQLARKLIKTIDDHYRIIPLNTLKNRKYRLKKQIYITIESEEDVIIASLDDIEAFAYAETEFEAINDLCKEIIMVYEDLSENRESLGTLPQKWLEYLEEVIDYNENQ